MKTVKNREQRDLWDPFGYLGEKRLNRLKTSWPGVFRSCLLDVLPVEELGAAFTADFGRPSKDLRVMLGVLILQQLQDLTDVEAADALAFDLQWHFALDITDESDASKYVAERTLRYYRNKVVLRGLDAVLFRTLTDALIDAFGVSTKLQRLDSTHICSNMRELRRLELFATVVRDFLADLQQHDAGGDVHRLDPALFERYTPASMKTYFGQVKPQSARPTLERVAADLLVLVETFAGNTAVRGLRSYQNLQRVLAEQCEVVRDTEAESPRVVVKNPREVPSNCLQNPSDPDATYDAHKGVGYQVQLAETYQPVEEGQEKDKTIPDLITCVAVEPANRSDVHALLPMLEETGARGCAPEVLLADTAYGSDANVEGAKAAGTEVIAPPPGTGAAKGKLTRAHFELSAGGCRCPEGHAATSVENHNRDGVTATFPRSVCEACPRRGQCPIKRTKAGARLKFTPKQTRLALRRSQQKSPPFIETYRWRAGVEGSASRYKMETGAGRLRVRGMSAVRAAATLKALALNILRAGRALAARLARFPAILGPSGARIRLASDLKRTIDPTAWISRQSSLHPLKMAA